MKREVLVFHRDAMFDRLSGTPDDLQRRVWVIGGENADNSFSGIFTRRRRADIATQPWRYHDDEEIEFIVEGRMELEYKTDDDAVERVELGRGDLFCIPAGVRHRADSIGDEICVGLLFCPTRYLTTEGQPFFLDGEERA